MHSVETLQSEIASIRSAITHGELAAVPALLEQHDLHLHEYCKGADVEAARDGLTALHAMQQDVIALMRERQQRLLELMRAHRHSHHAARAYTRAGQF
ncbi:MAG TPA: hypothetical protein DDZ67_10345 [Xanthomonadaceae bacterium]|nr:hypothetical protein [Xanthomonadaceae bacterium]